MAYTIQVIPGYYEVWILPIEKEDHELFYNGAGGFFDMTGEEHGTFFEDAKTLANYIEEVRNAGFDDKIIDPFDLLAGTEIVPSFPEFPFGSDEETISTENEIVEAQRKAIEIKNYEMERTSTYTKRKELC